MARPKREVVKYQFYAKRDLLYWFVAYAREHGVTVSSIMNNALEAYKQMMEG
jgi:hypothetical protein